MPSPVVHVFVSSTWLDLRPERLAAEAALGRMRETKFAGMEYFGSRDEDTHATSLDEVDRSQVYIGIIGGRYGSGITEAEYRRARGRKLHCFIYLKEEDCITPETREADADKAGLLVALKDELRRNHIVTPFSSPADLAAKVTADLHRWLFDQYVTSSNAPFQAPPLPEHFVPRPEVSRDLTDRLLSEKVARPGVLVISAIQGMGGIGKSTLAAALAHDPEVRVRFRDGLLWATLGQQPELLPLLGGWVQALGDYHFKPLAVEATSAHLRTLLQDRSALLVVDDAWDPAHVPPFLVGGPRCRVLVTTREATIAKATGAALYDLDVMTPEQSLALLAGRLGRDLVGTEQDQALALADAVGYLPLALELAAAQVADGISWDELLGDLRAEVARLEALELSEDGTVPEAMLKRLSLLGSFSLSLRRLSDPRRRDFAWLGVLPEDVTLAPAMAATLWGTDERTARTTLRHLRDKALLLPGPPQPGGTPTYRVHDLLHDLARRLLTTPAEPRRPDEWAGLGLTLPEAHAALLGRYRARTRDGLWHTLPDDGYIHNTLAWHLEQAGHAEELHALLREETAEGRNGWFEAREWLGQVAGYLEDVARVRRNVEGAFRDRQECRALGQQCRYALIIASLNSLAGNIPSPLLAALVEQGVWSPSQGLAYVRQIPDHSQQAETLARLVPHLEPPQCQQILRETLEAVQAVSDKRRWSEALASLASRLAELGHPREALEAAQAIGSEGERSEVLATLAPHLEPTQRQQVLREAWVAAMAIDDKPRRVRALAALAQHLKPSQRQQVLRKVLVAAMAIDDEPRRVRALASLAPHMEALGYPREVMEATWTIKWEQDKWAYDDGWDQADATAALDQRLTDLDQSYEALEVVRAIGNKRQRAGALVSLAPRLDLPQRQQVLREALEAARVIGDEWQRAGALAALAPHLAELGHPREALKTAQAIGDERRRAEALAALTLHLQPPRCQQVLCEAMKVAQAIGDERQRAGTLAALAPHLAELGHPREALEAVRAIGVEWERAKVLATLAPHLQQPQRQQVLREALAAAQAIGDERQRVEALAALAPHLQPPQRQQILREALEMAWSIGDERQQAGALVSLAPRLAELGHPREALAAAQAIGDERRRAEALAALAPHLPPPQRQQILREALEASRAIGFQRQRASGLRALAPRLAELPPAMLYTLWSETLWVLTVRGRPDLLSDLRELSPVIVTLGGAEAVTETIRAIQDVQRWWP
jgi:hypothetical protein